MSKKLKDTDYLYISTRLRALEGRMLTEERRARMLEAKTNEDAAKVLSECGFEGLEPLSAASLEASLKRSRDETFEELAGSTPNKEIVDVFRIKYDYHNAKALIKCDAAGQSVSGMLIDAGRYSADIIQNAFARGDYDALSLPMQASIPSAVEALAATGDPQKSDFILDRACYSEMLATAEASRSDYLVEYVRLQIDAANLKSAVRTARMKKSPAFLNEVMNDGGNIPSEQIISAVLTGSPLEPVFTGILQSAAAVGDKTVQGGSQTAFECAVDNALGTYLRQSRMIPFGDGVLIAYAAARENDITAARIILSGRLAGVPTDSIRERLREAYV